MNETAKEIYDILSQWNIKPHQVVIDKEAEDLLLVALRQNPTAVYIDHDNSLIIEQE